MLRPTMLSVGPYSFTAHDAVRTLGNLGGLWAGMMQGRTSRAAERLGIELADRLAMTLTRSTTEPDSRSHPADETMPLDERLAELGQRAASKFKESPALAEVLGDVWTTLRSASDALRADGRLPATATGTVVQLNTSGGGVPKLPVASIDVGFRGVIGDVQRVRIHHGRPWQALCIYADEVIEELRREGHPITRGSVGENITVSGLPWAEVRPGVLLRIGSVLAHVQAYAEPCNSNRQFFLGGDFQRMNINRGPVSRVYATVLQPGHVDTGDAVVLEPQGASDIESLTTERQNEYER